MPDPDIHVIATHDPRYGVMVQSPQLPDLVGGRATLAELENDLVEILRFGGAPDEYRLVRYLQKNLVTNDGREYAVRWRVGDLLAAERAATVDHLVAAMSVPAQRDAHLDNEVAANGVVVFVAVAPTDIAGQVFAQMYEHHDAMTAVMAVADGVLLSTQFATRDAAPAGWGSAVDSGVDEKSTMGDVLRRFNGVLQERALVVAP